MSSVVAIRSTPIRQPSREISRSQRRGQLGDEVGPLLLVKLIDKARTIQLLEKLGIGEIFGIRGFCRRDFFTQLVQYDSNSFLCRIGFDGDKLFQQLIGLFQFSLIR
jgi:hypothetical protein